MSDNKNFTTISKNDVGVHGIDEKHLGRTVSAEEFKKLAGITKKKATKKTAEKTEDKKEDKKEVKTEDKKTGKKSDK